MQRTPVTLRRAPPSYWIDGGPTALWNLVLLCKAHHHDTHRGHWTITITNGTVHVTRPSWAEPGPTQGLGHQALNLNTDGSSDGAGGRGGSPGDASSGGPASADQPSSQPRAPARAWPWTGDVPWLTQAEADKLNPWGDQPTRRTTVAVADRPTDGTAWVSPWGDENNTPSPGP